MSFNTDLDRHIFNRMLHSEDRLVPIVTPEKKRVTNQIRTTKGFHVHINESGYMKFTKVINFFINSIHPEHIYRNYLISHMVRVSYGPFSDHNKMIRLLGWHLAGQIGPQHGVWAKTYKQHKFVQFQAGYLCLDQTSKCLEETKKFPLQTVTRKNILLVWI